MLSIKIWNIQSQYKVISKISTLFSTIFCFSMHEEVNKISLTKFKIQGSKILSNSVTNGTYGFYMNGIGVTI